MQDAPPSKAAMIRHALIKSAITKTICALLLLCLAASPAIADDEKHPQVREAWGLSSAGQISVNIIPLEDGGAQLSVFNTDEELVVRRTFDEGETCAVGGFSGFYTPIEQPIDGWLIITKHGGYDGRTLIIDTRTGELLDLPGGEYLIDEANGWFFSFHETDSEALITVLPTWGFEVHCANTNPDQLTDRQGNRIHLPESGCVYPPMIIGDQLREAREGDQRAADAELPVWQPVVGEAPDFSEAAQAQYRAWVEDTFEDPADADTFWDIIGCSCSWYCGGWYDSLTASSTLPAQEDITYAAENAHDLLYNTAWVEGVEGPGIGESLTYRFTNDCPRITEIIIHNGYIKSPEAWLNNNRVESLRLRINGEPTAILELADERGGQSFDLEALGGGPLGRRDDGEDLVLTFEIVSVYPGEKHDDTAITEIYFDGIDVH